MNNQGADRVTLQEFSIEIPDKDADTIHSGMLSLPAGHICQCTDVVAANS